MTFDAILAQVLDLLQREKRVSYRALKRRFDLDDNYLEDVKDELIYAKQLAVDEEGRVLVWTGGTSSAPTTASPVPLSATPDVSPAQVEAAPVAPPTPEAERRQLTVMFCDLVDSTKLSSQLDPEEYRDVVCAYQRVCTEVIQRYNGHIAQLLGDGLLIYFGYPQAHEDDAQRAVRAGLGMLAALGDLNNGLQQAQGVQLALRVGMHTGLVVVGEMGGAGRQEQLALGDVPNIAARIQGLAAPNSVVISQATSRLVQGYFECQELGAQQLRGVAEPVIVYRVLGESGVQSRLDVTQTRGLMPLVGRESEVTILLERWYQAKEGQGQVVLLTGEGGIGKSRLVQVLKDYIASEPHTRWECRSVPYYQNTALYPLTDFFQRALPWQQDETFDTKVEKLEQALRQYRLPIEESVPLFAILFSLPVPEDRYPPLALSPQRQRQKILETIIAILLELAERQPVLLILEDLHWADPTTLECMHVLIDHTPTAPLYLLLTCRPEFQPSWHHRSYVTEVTVTRLSREQSARMAVQIAGGKTLPDEILYQIVDKTDGVPLFVEELTKAVLESGYLQEANGHYELTGTLPALAIPATLQDTLMARLDRLVTAKGVAQMGATIGRQFSYALLHAVAQLDEPTLQRELGRLSAAELVYQRGVPPQATYTFKHALIQDAAYQSLLRSTRQQYHQRIAQVLETQFPETAETQPELLAYHYTAAGLYEPALASWKQAGEQALARSAHREATRCLEEALEALRQLPDSREIQEQAVDVRLALRTALRPLDDGRRILTCLREAETLAESLDDPHRLGHVLSLLAIYYYDVRAYDQAMATAQRTLTMATARKDIFVAALASQHLGVSLQAQGKYRQALDCYHHTTTLLEGQWRYERLQEIMVPAVFARSQLAYCHAELGSFAAGRGFGEDGLQIAEAVAHPASLMFAAWGAGLLALRQGDLARALQRLEQAVRIGRQDDLSHYFPRMAGAVGEAYILDKRLPDAIALLTQARESSAVRRGGDRIALLCTLPLVHAHLLSGHLEAAQHLAAWALPQTLEYQERGHQAYVLRLLGAITAQRVPLDSSQAESHYLQALALADELGMRPLQAHCHRGLGMLYAATGQREQARTELSTAIEMYRAMEMTFWLPQTEAALAQVEGR
jgi:class 3 adenylate cyclase/tetratricopeptide (TPR) repeat protein